MFNRQYAGDATWLEIQVSWCCVSFCCLSSHFHLQQFFF